MATKKAIGRKLPVKPTRKETKAATNLQAPTPRVMSLKTLDVPKPQIEQFEFKGLNAVQNVYTLARYMDAAPIDFVMGETLIGVIFYIVGGWRKRVQGGETPRMILRLVTETELETTNQQDEVITVGGPQKLVHVSLSLENNANREYLLSQALEAQRQKAAIGPCTVYPVDLGGGKRYLDIITVQEAEEREARAVVENDYADDEGNEEDGLF
jgi:hypothetical protein